MRGIPFSVKGDIDLLPRKGVAKLLSSTIVLENNSDVAESFVEVIRKDITDGKVRVGPATRPEQKELLIRHQSRNSGSQKAASHIVSLRNSYVDTAGVLYPVVVSVTITVPENPVITNAKVYDTLHQALDLFVDDADFNLTTGTVDSLLIGEA